MGSIRDKGNTAFRDFVTEGVPASGANEPAKSEARAAFEAADAAVTAMATVIATGKAYASKALMDADLVPIAGTLAAVYNDSDDALNGFYVKIGATGTGSWGTTNIGFPASFAGDLSAVVAELALKANTTDVTTALALKVDLTALAASNGSTLWNFIRASSGAVSRTGEDKIREGIQTVRDFGAATDGTTDARPAFVLVDAVGTFVIPRGNYLVSTSITLSRLVRFDPGAKLVIPNGVTVTFSKGIEAGDYQIFTLSGTGNVAGLPRANAAWFVGDIIGTATDATTLLNKIDGACLSNARVDFPKGDYTIAGTTAITFTKGQKVFGAGVNATRILWTSTTTNGFSFTTTEAASVSDMTFTVASDTILPVAGIGISFGAGAGLSGAENVKVQRALCGVKHENTGNGGYLRNSVISDSLYAGHWIKNTDNVIDRGLVVSAFSTLIDVSSTAGFINGESISWPSGVHHDGSWGYTLSSTFAAIFINIVAPTVGQVITGATSGATCTVTAIHHPHAGGALRLEDRVESYVSQQCGWAGGSYAFVSTAATAVKGSQPYECHFVDNFFDHTYFGMDLQKFLLFRFTGGWCSAVQGNGWAAQNCDGLEFDGFSLMNCWYSGGLIKATAKNINIRGGYNRGANLSGGTSPAFYIESNTNRVRIMNVNFDNGVVYGSVPNGALFVEPGTSANIRFIHNDTYGRAITTTGVTGSNNDFSTGNV